MICFFHPSIMAIDNKWMIITSLLGPILETYLEANPPGWNVPRKLRSMVNGK